MIIVDKALERRELDGNPIRVGMVGAGYMGQGMAAVIERNMTGMRLVAVANRTLDNAERAAHKRKGSHRLFWGSPCLRAQLGAARTANARVAP